MFGGQLIYKLRGDKGAVMVARTKIHKHNCYGLRKGKKSTASIDLLRNTPGRKPCSISAIIDLLCNTDSGKKSCPISRREKSAIIL